MYDATAAYRSTQVTATSPVGQVVLLYEGAIRFSAQAAVRLEAGDVEGSHHASLRAQEIVAALRSSLDLSAGVVATQLDSLYDYMLERLVAGNVAKDPRAAREVVGLLRDLLAAWRAIATPAAMTPAGTSPATTPDGTTPAQPGPQPVGHAHATTMFAAPATPGPLTTASGAYASAVPVPALRAGLAGAVRA